MTPGERSCSVAVWFLSRDIGRAIYLREVHRDDGTGHCAGCRSQVRWTPHPCLLRQLADETLSRLIPSQRGRDDH
ncbi:MAG: hypothetical protein JWO67_6475 [Streptosporangiaceae bacterium]|nr:hypothetical protein [Streptosporangiaceae bacterium]